MHTCTHVCIYMCTCLYKFPSIHMNIVYCCILWDLWAYGCQSYYMYIHIPISWYRLVALIFSLYRLVVTIKYLLTKHVLVTVLKLPPQLITVCMHPCANQVIAVHSAHMCMAERSIDWAHGREQEFRDSRMCKEREALT